MDNVLKYFKSRWIGFVLTLISILVVSLLHWVGVFDIIEMKSYDYRFHRIRGPLTGRTASDSSYIKRGTDVVLIEIDDESWQIIQEGWPYPRGKVWSKVIRNLYQAGAKVIVFDIQFDAPEAKSEYLNDFADHIDSDELKELIPRHGDILLSEAVTEAQAFGTEVVMSSKLFLSPTDYRQEISYPVDHIMQSNPETGLINDVIDGDGFTRLYPIYFQMDLNPTYYLTLGIKAIKAFKGIPDSVIPTFNYDNQLWNYGGTNIKAYGYGNTFLINYYGPASGRREFNLVAIKSTGGYITRNPRVTRWRTFDRYPLYQILDTQDYDLKEDDVDWFDQFLPGQIPGWILAIEDETERKNMMVTMGIGTEFDITKSPFYNKIVIIGATVEILHDFKYTPFYTYKGLGQQTPGMETHANAIQTILDQNYLNVLGGKISELYHYDYPMSHSWLIALLCLITFILLSFFNPVVAGIFILLEGIVYFGIVGGLFMDDLFWFIKVVVSAILPDSFVQSNHSWFTVELPEPGTSIVIPLVAPIIAVITTYTGNVIYNVVVEQKNKKFLKDTFGAYISPDLIDQMYEEKQEPKLGGNTGYHTAFFSDIQSFSAFSEVMEPEAMVKLMNDYLTEMTNILLDHQGTLDKYIGDSIVAFYGAPVPVEDHELLACKTALAMEKRIVDLREKWSQEEDKPDIVHNLRHRVGLNSGHMVTGNMGSEMRMNYTMMGDPVNVAARLESSAKQYGIYIQVAENTYEKVKDEFEWRTLDYVRVKGKKVPVHVYELLSEKGQLDDETSKMLVIFHEGLELYNAQKWNDALKKFEASAELEDEFPTRPTTPSKVYIFRCKHFMDNPPDKDWDGVWTMTTK